MVAARFEGVSKLYRRGERRGSIRQLVQRAFRGPDDDAKDIVKALEDVSFEVQAGESVGLIGPNGAGKTTILKLLSKVTYPTRGSVSTAGRLSGLVQIGAGFHPELSGRDNVFLNGAILGLSRAEVRRCFDEIVEFAGLGEFIDTPVKRYSSGMYARLGFAVAVHVWPDILLIDEVLAVGDVAFQYKSLGKLREFIRSGRTLIFVSHNLHAAQSLCGRILWIERGHVRKDGAPGGVIDRYLTHQHEEFLHSQDGLVRSAQAGIRIEKVVLRDGRGRETDEFAGGDEIVVELHYQVSHRVQAPHFTLGVSDPGLGLLFIATTLLDGWRPGDLHGRGVISCRFHGVSLMPKAYQLWAEVRDEQGLGYLVAWRPLRGFRVTAPPPELAGRLDETASIAHLRNTAPIYVPHAWQKTESA